MKTREHIMTQVLTPQLLLPENQFGINLGDEIVSSLDKDGFKIEKPDALVLCLDPRAGALARIAIDYAIPDPRKNTDSYTTFAAQIVKLGIGGIEYDDPETNKRRQTGHFYTTRLQHAGILAKAYEGVLENIVLQDPVRKSARDYLQRLGIVGQEILTQRPSNFPEIDENPLEFPAAFWSNPLLAGYLKDYNLHDPTIDEHSPVQLEITKKPL